jgi:outer membrane receptor for ferrienterochelin and colicins
LAKVKIATIIFVGTNYFSMSAIKKFIVSLLVLCSICTFGQQAAIKKIVITGQIIEKSSSLPLEYATVTFKNTATNQTLYGGVTDSKGNFAIEIKPGVYNIVYEFMSFKTIEIKAKTFITDTNLGVIYLEDAAKQLETVKIITEKTNIDIKLDKKIYNVGKDIIVKGGTVSDVLNNVPSVAVDTDGVVSLRGNENVRILIDGKPSNAVNINDALRLISADAVDKVEVVTNPSARYDAEGGGGILNIILKKGKNQGLNGTFIASVGKPENTSGSTNLNLKSEQFNFFTTLGYNKRTSPGVTKIDQENLSSGVLQSLVKERRESNRFGQGANINFGIELYLSPSASWTNAFNYRQNKGSNLEDVTYYNYDANRLFTNSRVRNNNADINNENVEYTTNFIKRFKKEGHKLSIDGAFSLENEKEFNTIEGQYIESGAFVSSEKSNKINRQTRDLVQADYVLPIKKESQFEAGFRGNYVRFLSDYQVQERATPTSPYTDIAGFTNTFGYIENVNALYTQFGSKISKLSYLFGIRYESSLIKVNQYVGSIFKTKKYDNFFPSIFLTYELSQSSNISLNYSRRITRPRDRFINPFTSYTSNINLFVGNPDINPAYSDAYDMGYLKKWDKITFSSSLYINHTTDAFQFVRVERGDQINGIPVIVNTAFNLGTNDKNGLEVTLNYNFKKWWKLNGNFNYYSEKTKGDYTYTNAANVVKTQNFDYTATTWTSRLTSKITLPYKIDWQINATYNAPQKNRQGIIRGVAAANIAFSKDILKDMGTLSFSVNDLFDSRRREQELQLPNVNSNSLMRRSVRQFTFSFTYRFNKKKTDKETKPKQNENGDSDIMG